MTSITTHAEAKGGSLLLISLYNHFKHAILFDFHYNLLSSSYIIITLVLHYALEPTPHPHPHHPTFSIARVLHSLIMGHGLWEGMERLIAVLSGLLHVILHIAVPHNWKYVRHVTLRNVAGQVEQATVFIATVSQALLLHPAVKSYPLY
jgi:hypothetical protein